MATACIRYGTSSGFPSRAGRRSNYWVDVVFDDQPGTRHDAADGDSASRRSAGATGVSVASSVTATFSEPLNAATVTRQHVRAASTAANVAGAGRRSATTRGELDGHLDCRHPRCRRRRRIPATLRGGATDPRIKDLAGNALAQNYTWSFTTGAAASCTGNPIVVENCLPGNPASEWDVSGVGDPSIQGFATDISVNRGGTVSFKVDTNASNYRFDIYRLGYYGGIGARKVATVQPSAALPQNQPNCLNDAATGLIDCGNWARVGLVDRAGECHLGHLRRQARPRLTHGGASHIVFIVRDDASTADILFQTADTTWQAYNTYGGNSLYAGQPAGRAYKVSYNRPFNTRGVDNGQDWLFNAEYPMVRWLEANGYDVSYFTGVDSDRGGRAHPQPPDLHVGRSRRVLVGGQRANVEAARDAGVHLAFFSGNEVFWKTRWENSIDGSGTPYRTLVCYKETQADAKIDPTADLDRHLARSALQPAGRRRSSRERADRPDLHGQRRSRRHDLDRRARRSTARCACGATRASRASAPGQARRCRSARWATSGTRTSTTASARRASCASRARRSMASRTCRTTARPTPPATRRTRSTLYKAPSGALVFGAGTVQWSWGLDANHDRAGTPADARMQQATVNLFADMGVQPATLQPGLVGGDRLDRRAGAHLDDHVAADGGCDARAGHAGHDHAAPRADAGGGVVGGVEVSVDGGDDLAPRQRARQLDLHLDADRIGLGRRSSHARSTTAATSKRRVRARTVTISSDVTCPCTIWSPSTSSDQRHRSGHRSRSNWASSSARTWQRLHHRHPLLQGPEQRRHARRQPVERRRRAAGHGHVRERDRVGLAAGELRRRRWRSPPTRFTWPRTSRRRDAIPAMTATSLRAASTADVLHALRNGESGGNGVYAYGASSQFPSVDVRRVELLGRRGVRERRGSASGDRCRTW